MDSSKAAEVMKVQDNMVGKTANTTAIDESDMNYLMRGLAVEI